MKGQRVTRRFVLRGLLPLAVLLVGVVVALLPESVWALSPYKSNPMLRLQAPSVDSGTLLGTDHLGRDIGSRIAVSLKTSLGIAAVAVILSTFLGVVFGVLSGYLGGPIDAIISRFADIQLSLPILLLIISFAAIFGTSSALLISLLAISGWGQFTRLVRAEVIRIKHQEFLEAGRALGASNARLVIKHVVPNVMPVIIVTATFEVARILLLESSISFLGLGIQPPTPSLGTMIADGRNYIYNGWWISVIPGAAIVAIVYSCNALGDFLRDAFDPKHRANS